MRNMMLAQEDTYDSWDNDGGGSEEDTTTPDELDINSGTTTDVQDQPGQQQVDPHNGAFDMLQKLLIRQPAANIPGGAQAVSASTQRPKKGKKQQEQKPMPTKEQLLSGDIGIDQAVDIPKINPVIVKNPNALSPGEAQAYEVLKQGRVRDYFTYGVLRATQQYDLSPDEVDRLATMYNVSSDPRIQDIVYTGSTHTAATPDTTLFGASKDAQGNNNISSKHVPVLQALNSFSATAQGPDKEVADAIKNNILGDNTNEDLRGALAKNKATLPDFFKKLNDFKAQAGVNPPPAGPQQPASNNVAMAPSPPTVVGANPLAAGAPVPPITTTPPSPPVLGDYESRLSGLAGQEAPDRRRQLFEQLSTRKNQILNNRTLWGDPRAQDELKNINIAIDNYEKSAFSSKAAASPGDVSEQLKSMTSAGMFTTGEAAIIQGKIDSGDLMGAKKILDSNLSESSKSRIKTQAKIEYENMSPKSKHDAQKFSLQALEKEFSGKGAAGRLQTKIDNANNIEAILARSYKQQPDGKYIYKISKSDYNILESSFAGMMGVGMLPGEETAYEVIAGIRRYLTAKPDAEVSQAMIQEVKDNVETIGDNSEAQLYKVVHSLPVLDYLDDATKASIYAQARAKARPFDRTGTMGVIYRKQQEGAPAETVEPQLLQPRKPGIKGAAAISKKEQNWNPVTKKWE